MGVTKTTGFSNETNDMSEIFKAIGHPARIAIIKLLSNIPSCVCGEIVEVLPLAQSTVSRHLTELKKVNLIHAVNKGNNIYYSLNQETWKKVKTFIKTIGKPDGSPFDCC
ncbi:ArsR/SmtB family transcription factor [Flavobacterium sp.]|jgi:DNA-binding transcriptional ArsR family regulator|uniref:ArsR/SmtB family transcription factor n=1 Tax=Flavobacterium sp. TaxID=239 RepID=UPI0037BE506D